MVTIFTTILTFVLSLAVVSLLAAPFLSENLGTKETQKDENQLVEAIPDELGASPNKGAGI